MTMHTTTENTTCTIVLIGRLDTTTAPQLDQEIQQNLAGIDLLILDFTALEYVSSAGLRVMLSAHKLMSKQGTLQVHHVNPVILEVLEMTGFANILHIV